MKSKLHWLGLASCMALMGCAAKYDEREGDIARSVGQIETAITQYKPLAEFGLPKAQRKLADLYVRQHKEAEAFSWYQKSASSGDLAAMHKIARMQAFSQAPSIVDKAQAYKTLTSLVDQDYAPATPDLMRFYLENSDYIPSQSVIAKAIAKAEAGDPTYCYMMGSAYLAGIVAAPNQAKIGEYFKCSLSKYPQASLELARVFDFSPELGDLPVIVTELEKQPREKQIRAFSRLANALAKEQWQRWGEYEAEEFYLKTLPEQSTTYAKLANLYMQYPSLGKSSDEVLSLLKQGQTEGDINAFATEGKMYLLGRGVIQDPWKAQQILEPLANQSPEASYLTGLLYFHGYLGEAEPFLALSRFDLAASKGLRKADKTLAKIYQEGRIVATDLVRAYAHYLLFDSSDEAIAGYLSNVKFSRFSTADQARGKALSQKLANDRQPATNMPI